MRTMNLSQIRYRAGRQTGKAEKQLARWRTAFALCAALGLLIGLAGAILGLFSLIGLLTSYPTLDVIDTFMIVAGFLLLFMAAHSVDKAQEVERSIRVEECIRTGMKDDCQC